MPGGNITDDYILIELLGKVFVSGAALLKNCPLLKQNYKRRYSQYKKCLELIRDQ